MLTKLKALYIHTHIIHTNTHTHIHTYTLRTLSNASAYQDEYTELNADKAEGLIYTHT